MVMMRYLCFCPRRDSFCGDGDDGEEKDEDLAEAENIRLQEPQWHLPVRSCHVLLVAA